MKDFGKRLARNTEYGLGIMFHLIVYGCLATLTFYLGKDFVEAVCNWNPIAWITLLGWEGILKSMLAGAGMTLAWSILIPPIRTHWGLSVTIWTLSTIPWVYLTYTHQLRLF